MSDTAETEGVRHDHRCQTEGCPNDFVIITINVDTSTTNCMCWGCNVAWNLAIIQRMGENGDFDNLPVSVTSSGPAAPNA